MPERQIVIANGTTRRSAFQPTNISELVQLFEQTLTIANIDTDLNEVFLNCNFVISDNEHYLRNGMSNRVRLPDSAILIELAARIYSRKIDSLYETFMRLRVDLNDIDAALNEPSTERNALMPSIAQYSGRPVRIRLQNLKNTSVNQINWNDCASGLQFGSKKTWSPLVHLANHLHISVCKDFKRPKFDSEMAFKPHHTLYTCEENEFLSHYYQLRSPGVLKRVLFDIDRINNSNIDTICLSDIIADRLDNELPTNEDGNILRENVLTSLENSNVVPLTSNVTDKVQQIGEETSLNNPIPTQEKICTDITLYKTSQDHLKDLYVNDEVPDSSVIEDKEHIVRRYARKSAAKSCNKYVVLDLQGKDLIPASPKRGQTPTTSSEFSLGIETPLLQYERFHKLQIIMEMKGNRGGCGSDITVQISEDGGNEDIPTNETDVCDTLEYTGEGDDNQCLSRRASMSNFNTPRRVTPFGTSGYCTDSSGGGVLGGGVTPKLSQTPCSQVLSGDLDTSLNVFNQWRSFMHNHWKSIDTNVHFHNYCSDIVKQCDEGGGKLKFNALVKDRSRSDFARYFMAALHLAHSNNIEFDNVEENNISRNLSMRLLSRERHYDRFDDFGSLTTDEWESHEDAQRECSLVPTHSLNSPSGSSRRRRLSDTNTVDADQRCKRSRWLDTE